MRKMRVVLPLSLAWVGLAYAAMTTPSPFDVLPALAIVGSPFVGYWWGWVFEKPRLKP